MAPQQITGPLESAGSLVIAAAAGSMLGGLTLTRTLLVVLVSVAAAMVVVHLVSVLLSRRLS
jgi:hypothetical protein